MANPPIGNNFWEGVLGVVDVTFNSVDMGKTTDDTTITKIEDIKDIFFQQDGTQPSDKIRTGMAYQVVCTFGQITTARLDELFPGMRLSGDGNSVKLGRTLYISGKDTEAKQLELTRVDSEGNASSNALYKMVLYKAFAQITGSFIYGSDTQTGLEVTFYAFWDDSNNAFGYTGNPTSVGL